MSFELPPTRIKRKYKCASCDHNTVNPRVHLKHRIDAHGHKLKIVECPLCVYACQYRQKLNRHLRLVHHYPQPGQHSDSQNLNNQDFFQDFIFQSPSLQQTCSTAPSSATMVYNDDEPIDLSFPQELKQLIHYLHEQERFSL